MFMELTGEGFVQSLGEVKNNVWRTIQFPTDTYLEIT